MLCRPCHFNTGVDLTSNIELRLDVPSEISLSLDSLENLSATMIECVFYPLVNAPFAKAVMLRFYSKLRKYCIKKAFFSSVVVVVVNASDF